MPHQCRLVAPSLKRHLRLFVRLGSQHTSVSGLAAGTCCKGLHKDLAAGESCLLAALVLTATMGSCCCPAGGTCAFRLLLQDFYALPVPKALRSGDNAGSFAFLEKKLHLSQM